MSAGAAWVHESVIISLADRAGGEWSRKVRRRCPRRTTRCCSSDEYSITSVKRAMATSDFKRSEDFIVRAQKLLSRDLSGWGNRFQFMPSIPLASHSNVLPKEATKAVAGRSWWRCGTLLWQRTIHQASNASWDLRAALHVLSGRLERAIASPSRTRLRG